MKAKTIRKVLNAKVNDWLESIDDEVIRDLAKDNAIVTGGCIASMLLKEDVNDFDIYFKTKDATQRIAQYYVDKFPHPLKVSGEEDRVRIVTESGHRGATGGEILGSDQIDDTYEEAESAALKTEDDDKPKYRPVFMSTNAITLSHKIQLVIRFFGPPDQIHENYDFVHCTNYWTPKDDKLVLRPDALESLLSRELIYVGSKYPVCSVIRLRKFIARKWTINAGQILKMCMQISALDMTDPKVLEDQLTGVDAAYFMQLIHQLKEKNPDKVDTGYLVEIINRLF